MNKMKNNFPSIKKGMDRDDKNKLNKLRGVSGRLRRAIRNISNPRRRGRGWWGKSLKYARNLLTSLGYNVPAGRNKAYGQQLIDDFLSDALLVNEFKIDRLIDKPVGVSVQIEFIRVRKAEREREITTLKELRKYLLDDGERTVQQVNKIIKERKKTTHPYLVRTTLKSKDAAIEAYKKQFKDKEHVDSGYVIITDVKVKDTDILGLTHTWKTIPLKDRHAPKLITFDNIGKNISDYINNNNDQCVIDYIYEYYIVRDIHMQHSQYHRHSSEAIQCSDCAVFLLMANFLPANSAG